MATAGDQASLDFDSIKAMDKQIDVLLQCKPLPESEIRQLCEQVSITHTYGLSKILSMRPSTLIGQTQIESTAKDPRHTFMQTRQFLKNPQSQDIVLTLYHLGSLICLSGRLDG